MQEAYCQSCGKPFGSSDDFYGTRVDGAKCHDYCGYCFIDGAFVKNATMHEMIEESIPYVCAIHPELNANEVRLMMLDFFPTLKRWRNQHFR
jgi:Putative zinc ribbon domain